MRYKLKNFLSIKSLSIFLILLISGVASAQLKSDSWLWTLNLGYTSVKSNLTQESLNGYTFNSTIEKHMRNGHWAYGLNLAFLSANDELIVSSGGEKIYYSISSTALFLTAKYFFTKTEIVPYIGLGLGVNFANNDRGATGFYDAEPTAVATSSSLTGLALALPVGMNWFLDKQLFIGINVVPTWTEKTFFESKFNFLINFSLGFQF
jgi:outer membrane protein W